MMHMSAMAKGEPKASGGGGGGGGGGTQNAMIMMHGRHSHHGLHRQGCARTRASCAVRERTQTMRTQNKSCARV
jgi:hypothetical protein